MEDGGNQYLYQNMGVRVKEDGIVTITTGGYTYTEIPVIQLVYISAE